MLNCSYLGISSGLPGSQIDDPKYLVLIGIQSFDDPPHLDDLDKSLKKYGSLSCYLAASAVYELRGKTQTLRHGPATNAGAHCPIVVAFYISFDKFQVRFYAV